MNTEGVYHRHTDQITVNRESIMKKDNKLSQNLPLITSGIVIMTLLLAGRYQKTQQMNPHEGFSSEYFQEAGTHISAEQLMLVDQLGMKAQDFTVKDTAGTEHTLSHYAGREVVLVMWASWCQICRNQLPMLVELRDRYSSRDVAILAVSFEKENVIENYLNGKDINFPVISLENQNFPDAYKQISSFPSYIFIGKNQEMKLAIRGKLSKEQIEKLLKI